MGILKKIKDMFGGAGKEEPVSSSSTDEFDKKGETNNKDSNEKTDPFTDYFVASFLHGEAEYRGQSKRMERFSLGDIIRLGDVVDFIMDEDISSKLAGLSICRTNEFGGCDENRFIDRNEEIRNYDLLKTISYFGEDGGLYPMTGENVTLTLLRRGGLPIVLFARNMWTTPEVNYIRIYTMVSGTNADDDMRTDRSHNIAHLDSTLLAYRSGNGDLGKLIDLYQDTEARLDDLLHDGKALENNYQEAVCEGLYGRQYLGHYADYGNWLLGQNRYFDAQRQFTRVLTTTDNPLDNLNHGDQYGTWNYNMALCLMASHDYKRAFHYMEVGTFLNIDTRKERMSLLASLGTPGFLSYLENIGDEIEEGMKSELKETYNNAVARIRAGLVDSPSSLTVGSILSNFLRINRHNAISMVVCRHDGNKYEYEQVKDDDELWSYRFGGLLQDGNTIVIRFSGAYYQCGIEDDKSKLCHDNSIIMQITAIPGKELMRVDVAVPGFVNDPDEIQPQLKSFDCYKTFVVSAKPFEYDFKKPVEDTFMESVSLYNNNSYRVAESLLGLTHIYYSLLSDYSKLSDDMKQLLLDAAAKVGSCLMELGEPDVAEYWLNYGYQSRQLNNMMEYVNCLTNLKDVRAMPFIDNILLALNEAGGDDDTLSQWHSFLKRRKAYVLIDWGMLKEAKEFLMEIVKDPMCAEFATHELAYLESI